MTTPLEIPISHNQVRGDFTPSGPLTVVTSAIAVTPDTIAAVLHERKGTGGTGTAGWFGISISIWAAYFSATFHDALGLKADIIEAVFLIFGFVSVGATIISLVRYLVSRKKSSVENIVLEITRRSKQKFS